MCNTVRFSSLKPCLKIDSQQFPLTDKMRYLEEVFQERFDHTRHIDYDLSKAKGLYFGS